MKHPFARLSFLFQVCLIALVPTYCVGQKESESKIIEIDNPSFEGIPQCCEAPEGWFDCGLYQETAPDIQPGSFEVNKAPHDGNTYVSLVVRDNNTWEALGQELSLPLKKGQCYTWDMHLAQSSKLMSESRSTGERVNYNRPVIIRIYGGTSSCKKSELLAQSVSIDHADWKSYTFELNPKLADYPFIFFGVYFVSSANGKIVPYNGNVLVDDVSNILPATCPDSPSPSED